MKILITEFINKNSLDVLNNTFEVKFDEKLWEKNAPWQKEVNNQ